MIRFGNIRNVGWPGDDGRVDEIRRKDDAEESCGSGRNVQKLVLGERSKTQIGCDRWKIPLQSITCQIDQHLRNHERPNDGCLERLNNFRFGEDWIMRQRSIFTQAYLNEVLLALRQPFVAPRRFRIVRKDKPDHTGEYNCGETFE